MSWYEEFLKNEQNENPLERKYQSLCRQVRTMSMRFEIAQNDPVNSKETINDLYWQLETLKSQRNQVARELRSTPRVRTPIPSPSRQSKPALMPSQL